MANALDVLRERNLIQQHTDETALRELFSKPTVCYVGFDGTASSLHVGHLIPVMALAHLQRAGHHVIAVVGGGTSMIGDPSGKTEMRKLISAEDIAQNVQKIGRQIGRYVDFQDNKGTLVDNGEWLLPLNYIEFLREIGRHFSVNRMLAAEAYKQRLERGLSFIEFNYQLLQAYDYLMLHQRNGCMLQMGGDDQWGNILAGVDLVRRVTSHEVHALTYPLLTTAEGKKMGKTEAGAVWLDADLMSAYDFYQYWLNVDDRDVGRLLGVFTFLDIEEVRALGQLQGADTREGKRKLAYEVTALAHGVEAAKRSEAAAGAAFGRGASDLVPTTEVTSAQWDGPVLDLFVAAGLVSSKGEGRRLITQGGASVGERKVHDEKERLTSEEIAAGEIVLRAGKKKIQRIVPKAQ